MKGDEEGEFRESLGNSLSPVGSSPLLASLSPYGCSTVEDNGAGAINHHSGVGGVYRVETRYERHCNVQTPLDTRGGCRGQKGVARFINNRHFQADCPTVLHPFHKTGKTLYRPVDQFINPLALSTSLIGVLSSPRGIYRERGPSAPHTFRYVHTFASPRCGHHCLRKKITRLEFSKCETFWSWSFEIRRSLKSGPSSSAENYRCKIRLFRRGWYTFRTRVYDLMFCFVDSADRASSPS